VLRLRSVDQRDKSLPLIIRLIRISPALELKGCKRGVSISLTYYEVKKGQAARAHKLFSPGSAP
jgi:hypothetical protein